MELQAAGTNPAEHRFFEHTAKPLVGPESVMGLVAKPSAHVHAPPDPATPLLVPL